MKVLVYSLTKWLKNIMEANKASGNSWWIEDKIIAWWDAVLKEMEKDNWLLMDNLLDSF